LRLLRQGASLPQECYRNNFFPCPSFRSVLFLLSPLQGFFPRLVNPYRLRHFLPGPIFRSFLVPPLLSFSFLSLVVSHEPTPLARCTQPQTVCHPLFFELIICPQWKVPGPLSSSKATSLLAGSLLSRCGSQYRNHTTQQSLHRVCSFFFGPCALPIARLLGLASRFPSHGTKVPFGRLMHFSRDGVGRRAALEGL